MKAGFDSAEAVSSALRSVGYVASPQLARTVHLAIALGKPILCEGPAGVGKTELAKALAAASDRSLHRLQCYEGLDESKTLYEWKYPKQLLYSQLLRDRISSITAGSADLAAAIEQISEHEDAFFSERFLEARPLLAALRSSEPTVLLIDEVDRAEDELEAFFLELLAEYQVTIPELGTIVGQHRPLAILTSNASRELSDALRRRCLYLPMDFPEPEQELEIVRARVPEIDKELAGQLTAFVARLRSLDLKKSPSVAETIDWARSLVVLEAPRLDREIALSTLSVLLKYRGDVEEAAALASELPSARDESREG
ncbi:MAG: MoxR family ATPase [Deltaproteobacteria bacterium]|nr:MoxR family ATPase [Deltaproteobacteria bacterium]